MNCKLSLNFPVGNDTDARLRQFSERRSVPDVHRADPGREAGILEH
jgi:hypothetical protein